MSILHFSYLKFSLVRFFNYVISKFNHNIPFPLCLQRKTRFSDHAKGIDIRYLPHVPYLIFF